MADLTLVPSTLAKVGHRFTFQGDPQAMECEGCPVRGVCFRLQPGRRYEVTAVRDVEHVCELHDGGKARVSEVKEIPLVTSARSKDLRGTALHWKAIPCGRPDCASWSLCHPVGPKAGSKMAVVSDDGVMDCPAGFDIHRVTLQPLE